ncbi:MAG: hypothetical protein ABL925_10255 [Methylococcales bacterium]
MSNNNYDAIDDALKFVKIPIKMTYTPLSETAFKSKKPSVFSILVQFATSVIRKTGTWHVETTIVLLMLCLAGNVYAESNNVTGSNNGDTIEGTAGDDVIDGLGGNDKIDGKEGVDTASYEHAAKKVQVNLSKKSAAGGAGKDKLSNIENVIGSGYSDILIGNHLDNVLTGLAGNDKLSGGNGNDLLVGGVGNDRLAGGTGNDTLLGGPGSDVMTGGKGADIFKLDSPSTTDKITDFSKVHGDSISLDVAVFPNQSFVAVKKLALAKNGERVVYEKATGRLFYDADGSGGGAAAQLLATLSNKPTLESLASAPCTANCGGGDNGNTNGGGVTPAFTTYRNATLPGRLLVSSSIGDTKIYNLQDGSHVVVPASEQFPDDDKWHINANGTLLTRLNTGYGRTKVTLDFFHADSPVMARTLVPIPDGELDAHGVRLSADGRYMLAFHRKNYLHDYQLTVFDALTGAIIEKGSLLDGMSTTGFPVAWLPNGDYMYLVDNKLYVTKPLSPDVRLLATLNLPGRDSLVSTSTLALSPDATRLAFTWHEKRRGSSDVHVYVVNLDGSGLHRLTAVPDPSTVFDWSYGSPTWSPDGQWLIMVLYKSGVVTAPVFPDDDFSPWKVIGTTGCVSPVIVLPATAENVAVNWPRTEPELGLKVRVNNHAAWLTVCSSYVEWIP